MSMPFERDYIGLSETLSTEVSGRVIVATANSAHRKQENNALGYKETELRLGLPGSVSPERKAEKGGKRGLGDATHFHGQWGSSSLNGSELELGRSFGLFPGNASEDLTGFDRSVNPAVDSPSKHLLENKISLSPRTTNVSAKTQVVGWPPIRSFRKNTMCVKSTNECDGSESKAAVGCLFVKVSMDGAPYLRKVDLKTCRNYRELLSALDKMFSCFNTGRCGFPEPPARDELSQSKVLDFVHGSDYVLTYEDNDGDWMLVGDVPWEMFTISCKRIRIMKGTDATGLAPRAMEKCRM